MACPGSGLVKIQGNAGLLCYVRYVTIKIPSKPSEGTRNISHWQNSSLQFSSPDLKLAVFCEKEMRNIPIGLDWDWGGDCNWPALLSRPISRHSYWLLECRQECEERLRERWQHKIWSSGWFKSECYFSQKEKSLDHKEPNSGWRDLKKLILSLGW